MKREAMYPPLVFSLYSTSASNEKLLPVQLSRNVYHRVADETMQSILDRLERWIEDADLQGSDVEYSSGVLTLKTGERGTFVLNKQPPNQQIWLSSPISGPSRYDYCGDGHGWVSLRTGRHLEDILGEELWGNNKV